jgi:hypothetical protein
MLVYKWAICVIGRMRERRDRQSSNAKIQNPVYFAQI